MLRLTLCAIAILGLTPSAIAKTDWPETFRKAVSGSQYYLDSPFSFEQVFYDGDGVETLRIGFDSERPDGEKFKLLSYHSELEDHLDEIKSDIQEEHADIWCDHLANTVKGGVKEASQSNDTVTFNYNPTDPDADDEHELKVVEKSKATIIIDKATSAPSAVTWELEKPFKPIFVAKVNKFKLNAECEMTPIGRPVQARTILDLDVSVLGQKHIEKTIITVEKLKFPGFSDE